MALYFVTGNPGKLLEAQRALGRFGVEVRGAKADFDEPRSDDLAQIARAKVRQAAKTVPAPTPPLISRRIPSPQRSG